MNNFKKYKNLLAGAAIAVFAIVLGACGDTSGIDLSGAAGQPTEPDSTNPIDVPGADVPTATPIPPATGHIIFTSSREGQTDLYITTPDGSEVTRLTTNGSVEESSSPQISPDGSKVAFVATVGENTDIYILDIASRTVNQVTDTEGRDSSPSWSPDSQRLVFESFRDGNLEIYVVNADGSNPTRLTDDPSGDSNPVWSPNSNDILFVSNRFGNSDLFLLSPNGAVNTLTTNPAPDNTPAWSPDGNFIAFQSFSGELANICLIGKDGLNQVCLTSNPDRYDTPVWSPDGNWIAVNAQTGIRVFNIRDGQVLNLSQAGVEPRGIPAWSPDGLRLAFQAFSGGDMELYYALVLTNEFTRITSIDGFDGKPVWASR